MSRGAVIIPNSCASPKFSTAERPKNPMILWFGGGSDGCQFWVILKSYHLSPSVDREEDWS